MTRYILGLIILLSVYALIKKGLDKLDEAEKRGYAPPPPVTGQARPSPSAGLPGLPPTLEGPLQAAQKQGAQGLRDFLGRYRYAIQDPKLASIELDYVVLINLQDPSEAKRVFKSVQQRTPTWSPIYERIKSLEKNYQ